MRDHKILDFVHEKKYIILTVNCPYSKFKLLISPWLCLENSLPLFHHENTYMGVFEVEERKIVPGMGR